jgi:hypothetical protein
MSGKVLDFRPEFIMLKEQVAGYERILRWIKSDLGWEVKVISQPKFLPTTIAQSKATTVEEKALLLTYEKKFDEQYSPDDGALVRIYPVFESSFDRKVAFDNNYYSETYASFYEIQTAIVPNLEGLIRPIVNRYNQSAKTRQTDVKEIVVEIVPQTKDKNITFRPYVTRVPVK